MLELGTAAAAAESIQSGEVELGVDPAKPQPNWEEFTHQDCYILAELAMSLHLAGLVDVWGCSRTMWPPKSLFED